MSDTEPIPSSRDEAFTRHFVPEIEGVEVRPYQIEAWHALDEARSEGKTRALMVMATGLGKTTVAAVDAKRFFDESENPNPRGLFLCHREEILEQAWERFQGVFGDEYRFGPFSGRDKDFTDPDFLFATFQTMMNWRGFIDPKLFDYIVVDEGHHGKAETYDPTIKHFRPQFLLGMTATPDRIDLQNIRDLFGQEVYHKTLAEGLAEGLLARPDYKVIIDDVQQGVYEEELGSIADLNKRYFIPRRDEEIADMIREKIVEAGIDDPRIIIFGASIEHITRFAEINSRYIHTETIHSGTNKWDRAEIMDGFRSGDIPAVATVDIFNEGVDVPDANVIVFLRQTQSETVFLQQLGRGLRKTANKDSVLVLDFVANCDRLMMLEELLSDIYRNSGGGGRNDFMGDDDLWDDPLEHEDFIPSDWDTLDAEADKLKDIGVGSFEFSETTREIMSLIRELYNQQESKKGWTSDRTIELYRYLSGDGPITKAALEEYLKTRKDAPGVDAVLRPFDDSIRRLQIQAGFEPIRRNWSEWDEDKAIEAYLELSGSAPLGYRELRRALGNDPDLPDVQTFLAPFGGIRGIQLRAGYEVKPDHSNLDAQAAIDIYRSLSGENALGQIALMEALRADPNLPSIRTILKPFNGKMREIQEAAGYEVLTNDWSSWSESDSIALYRQLSGDGPLSVAELNEALKDDDAVPSLNIVLDRVGGGIRQLQEASGYDVQNPTWGDWDRERSLDLLQSLGIERTTTHKQLREALNELEDAPGIKTVLGPFEGSIDRLKFEMGLQTYVLSEWTQDDTLNEYVRLSESLGRPAAKADFDIGYREGRTPSPQFMLKAFGGKISTLRDKATQ